LINQSNRQKTDSAKGTNGDFLGDDWLLEYYRETELKVNSNDIKVNELISIPEHKKDIHERVYLGAETVDEKSWLVEYYMITESIE
jgi:hypothetical protein